MENRGRPISASILQAYRRLIKHGLPSARERMAKRGMTICEIARITGTNRWTVYKYLREFRDQQKVIESAPKDGDMPDGVP